MPRIASERFKLTYMITSAHQGVIYDRSMLRAYVRRRVQCLMHRAEALAFIDDHQWLGRRRGQTPSSIAADILLELYG